MTRINKIVALKESKAFEGIDFHNCTDDQVNRLHDILNHTTKGIPRSTADWQFVNQLQKEQKLGKPIGQWK